MDNSWHSQVTEFLFGSETSFTSLDAWQTLAVDGVIFGAVLVVAFLLYLVTHKIVFRVVGKVVSKTKNNWDDELLESRLFKFLALLAPGVLIWKAGPEAFTEKPYQDVVRVISEVFIIVMSLLAVNSLLNVVERIYRRYEVSKKFPVKSFIQVVKIILLLCGIIFIVSTVIGKSPVLIFSGLGAMTAILMLIFKDSILGLVAGVQLSANRMVARGDWIEMPKFGADGEVLEVALTTVKVRNWDKTITTIPTYALISDSFKNWRGMSSSGVRRIKRSITLDMQTVKFVDDSLMKRLKKISILDDYLAEKEKEISEWNKENGRDVSDVVDSRCLTNVGTFRAYVKAYLGAHPKISQNETLLVRQLSPNEYGLPIEVYVFTTDNRWVEYEGIQSDIFDHFMAVMCEFGLAVYQRPSGNDFAKVIK